MTRFACFAYGGRGRACSAGLAALTLLGVACAAGVKPTQTTSGGGTGGVFAGTAGAAGTGTGTAGTSATGQGGQAGTFVSDPDAGACMQAEYMFTPKNTTVFVLVDRSGSEFDSDMIYVNLRAAVLQVIQQVQQTNPQVRFGWGAFVGDHASGTCMPVFDKVSIDVGNYGAIAAMYNSIAQLQPPGAKADTPASAVIPMVRTLLQNDTGNGQKYMLLVTDSETDFCDDGSAVCAADAVTHEIQDMYAAGIGTLVVGLPTPTGGIAAQVLKNLANAGAGQGVVIPPGVPTVMDVYYQCTGAGNGQWMSMYTAAGRTGMTPLATYSATAGTASVYTPSSTMQQALVDQISAALADVKSCTFDLSDVGGKSIKVVRTKLDKASVLIDGKVVPLDPNNANGWDMVTDTQLQLFGPACDAWRDPKATDIKFNFPCEIIIG